MAESGASRLDVRRKFGFIEGFFGWWVVLFRNDIVDGLFHLLLFFICLEKYN